MQNIKLTAVDRTGSLSSINLNTQQKLLNHHPLKHCQSASLSLGNISIPTLRVTDIRYAKILLAYEGGETVIGLGRTIKNRTPLL